MSSKTYNLQAYTLVLDKILFVTGLFKAENNEGVQFNVGFGSDTRITAKFPTRAEATLSRDMLVRAIRES